MSKQRILVTGAAGFMGSHLTDALVDAGHEVYGVDDMSGGFWRNVNPTSNFTRLDLRQREETKAYIGMVRPEIIFHLAADATEGRSQFTPVTCTERNLMAYLHTVIPAIRHGLRKVVVTSSMSVYGAQTPPFDEALPPKPEDIYGVSKAAMEKVTQILSEVHGFAYTIVRPHNVYGPRQNIADPYRNVIGIFINSLLNDKRFYIYGDGEQRRAFTYIDDFTPYMARAGFDPRCDGEIINIGPCEEVTINYLSDIVTRLFLNGHAVPETLRPVYLPPRPMEVRDAYCTDEKARRVLGYHSTISLEEGVRRMMVWAKELGPQTPRYMEDGLELVTEDTPITWTQKLI
jgi:UDP-glucose 4-epimerase